MKDLKDLLKHEVMDLYSAEEQIIEALPKMIKKANDPALKNALQDHLTVTENQKQRLDKVQSLLREQGEETPAEKKGFLSGLFGGGAHKCKGTQGLIEEGEKVMGENMNPEVMDAAIISCAQKIEHYEICGYGTAKAFALELNLNEAAQLLDETLNEEYEADDRLTEMAVGRLNKHAEGANDAAGNAKPTQGKAAPKSLGNSVRSAAGNKSAASARADNRQVKPASTAKNAASRSRNAGPPAKGTGVATSRSKAAPGKAISVAKKSTARNKK